MGPGPAVAEIRNAVRDCLADLEPGCLVLAACSGGADSLALAAALAFAGPRLGLRCGGVTVDHGLQDGSAQRAVEVAATLTKLNLDPVCNLAVEVRAGGGPEAAARSARYRALDELAAPGSAATAILLGHTLDDQAETVLLGLARGAGGRSLAGMPARRGPYRRPLLGVRRASTMAACAELGLDPWQDPHNADPRYARARVRHQALPALEAALGPGVAQALARTARQLRADADYLDALAFAESERLTGVSAEAGLDVQGLDVPGLDVPGLAALPEAIRMRVLRLAALTAGCPPGALTAGHLRRADELVTSWHGQRWADLPGGVRVRRRDGRLRFATEAPEAPEAPGASEVTEATEVPEAP
jgi:tRNA(Ile)-lysidine synthase